MAVAVNSIHISALMLVVLIFMGYTTAGKIPGTPKFSANLKEKKMHPDFRDATAEPLMPRNLAEMEANFWLGNAQSFVQRQLQQKNENIAKNIIFFIGDGMSATTLAATRMYLGGEEKSLSFEEFPVSGMAKTYCVDVQVADSACSATAYLCGVKNNDKTIGVSAEVKARNCTQELDKRTHTPSIAKWAIDAGKDAGLVTTTRVTHASPAGVYANTAFRDWENNAEVLNGKCDDKLIDDIAEQMIHGEVGSKLKVVLGCGRREFLDRTMIDEEGTVGKRSDAKNLIQEWLDAKEIDGSRAYVWNKTELDNVDPKTTDYLLGLFENDHCQYNLDIVANNLGYKEPSLMEMTEKAIQILRKNEKGFFLFVEGGRIDHAHHDTKARKALDETAEFSKAIDLARRMTSVEDTLIVVSADHGHTITYAGYSDRGTDIFGFGGDSDMDDMPYMTLSYDGGPGYNVHVNRTNGTRVNPRTVNMSGRDALFPGTVPMGAETHSGEDVVVYASGPWSKLFTGIFEQNFLPHAMAYAACIGNGLTACD